MKQPSAYKMNLGGREPQLAITDGSEWFWQKHGEDCTIIGWDEDEVAA